ncbi:MAG: 4Fe-4S binding protein [Sulfuricella sp.]
MDKLQAIRAGSAIPMEFMSDPEVCDGCGQCVISCREALGGPEGTSPGIQIVAIGDRHIPIICHNCEEAPCVSGCMPGCRHRDEATGRIVTDYERCVGCWMCVMLCPFGAIQRVPTQEGAHFGVALKCDSCLDKQIVPCIAACKPGGLKEADPLALAREKREKAARQLAGLFDAE